MTTSTIKSERAILEYNQGDRISNGKTAIAFRKVSVRYTTLLALSANL
ncbi:hypothetical protein [Nostoc sp.]